MPDLTRVLWQALVFIYALGVYAHLFYAATHLRRGPVATVRTCLTGFVWPWFLARRLRRASTSPAADPIDPVPGP